MKLSRLIAEISATLASAGIENCANEARWLVMEAGGYPASARITDPEVPAAAEAQLRQLAERRAAHEPLQYLLGTAPFDEMELIVTPDVLIPRPETEVLARFAAKQVRQGGTLLDLGCGSGAIALLAARSRPDIRVTAADVSAAALAVARRNAEKYALSGRIEQVQSNLFAALEGRQFDVIAANLPYVTFDEYETLAPEVRRHEPQLALTSPDQGMALILQAVAALPDHLASGGTAVFEMSVHQTGRARQALANAGLTVGSFSDQYGCERFVFGVRP